MNVTEGFGLYFVGAFSLIVLSLLNILPRDYLGAFVIFLFIGSCFFALFAAIFQTQSMISREEREKATAPKPPAEQEGGVNREEEQKKLKEQEVTAA